VASFRKIGKVWRAEIVRIGHPRESQSGFATKAEAQAWAGPIEAAIIAEQRGNVPDLPFSALLTRYSERVSSTKKGARWETIRIALLQRDPLALVRLKDFSGVHVSGWRDRRLQAVSASSVRREWNLLSHACNVAVKEWKWLRSNPFREVKRPKEARHRERLIQDAEIVALQERAATDLQKKTVAALLMALETGMRASEICGLQEIVGRVATLTDTKNGTSRQVPLSPRALEIWAESFPLGITPRQLDTTFRDLTKAAGIQGLHFHDSRHSACVRLSKKLNNLQLARMLGIRDPRILMVYFSETAEDIANSL